MIAKARDIWTNGAGDFKRAWMSLAATDAAYKAISFALLAPAVALFLKWLLSRTGTTVVADVDIARFFIKTPQGIIAIVLGGALIGALTAVEMACLMAIGHRAADGGRLDMRSALLFGAARSAPVLRLVGQMVLRVLAVLIPVALLLGAVYAALLRTFDINYYIQKRPPAFWAAAGLVGVIGGAAAAWVVWTITRWALALPLVLFERVTPERALGASAKLSLGRRRLIALVLLIWALLAVALGFAAAELVKWIGRAGAPHFAGSLALLIVFLTGLLLLWGALTLAVSIIQSSVSYTHLTLPTILRV